MDPILMLQILQYVALVPKAIPIIVDTIKVVKDAIDGGKSYTNDELIALVNGMVENHNALPEPE